METILQQLFDGKINPSEQYRPELQQYKDLVTIRCHFSYIF